MMAKRNPITGVRKTATPKLYWKKILETGRAPQVSNPGSDLAYDLFAAENVVLYPGRVTKVRTGIAIEFSPLRGAIIKDRSSMAAKGIRTSAGVVDAGYRGEIIVLLTLDTNAPPSSESVYVGAYKVNVGDKIAQMIPVEPQTNFEVIEEIKALSVTDRGAKGFGSSGK